MNDHVRFFAALSDATLLAQVEALAARQRDVNVELIASLAELDARKLYLRLGFSSLFSYCTRHLRLSRDAAYNRIEAARTARRFPVVLDLLASGDVTMTTVALLAKYLTEENHLALLDAARDRTKSEVQSQIAEMDPRPELDTLVVPLSGGRYRLEVTISAETHRTLRRLQEMMRHAVPNGDPAEIVSRGLALLLAHVERRKLADVRRPRGAMRASVTRSVPAAVRREVWKRDGAQCAFVGTSGRCAERSFLELHHVVPYSQGGATTLDNLQLRCRAHNQYEADQAGLSRPAGAPRGAAPTAAAPSQP